MKKRKNYAETERFGWLKQNRVKLKLIAAGVLSGGTINIATSFVLQTFSDFLASVVFASLGVVLICLVSHIWSTEKKLSNIHKLQLVFLGVSVFSFVFALVDVLTFVLTYGPNSLLVYNGPPYLTIGSIPFVSILFSFAIGGFFSVAERICDLHEKGRI
jgi:hypothetical protein